MGDYLSISSYLLDKGVHDDLLKIVDDNLNIHNYIDFLNVQGSISDEHKAIDKIIKYLIGKNTGRFAIILSTGRNDITRIIFFLNMVLFVSKKRLIRCNRLVSIAELPLRHTETQTKERNPDFGPMMRNLCQVTKLMN